MGAACKFEFVALFWAENFDALTSTFFDVMMSSCEPR
jgi:hypothetical protein